MNDQKITLLILAAGMGSRYGGLKQLDEFGPNGETIMDYSVFDAIQAGFNKLVFVIRESFRNEFKQRMESRWNGKIEMEYVNQELDDLPHEFICPNNRSKPWGTGHAVWVARKVINEPFGVINADDFYGREAMITLYRHLHSNNNFAVIAYLLKNTLSDHGAVNRGICAIDNEGYLIQITERKNIHKDEQIYFNSNGNKIMLPPDTLVSMNMWAFSSDYFKWADSYFYAFLQRELNNDQSEFYIPDLIQYLIDHKNLKVDVLKSGSNWIGVTYKEDKPMVTEAFKKMIQEGLYPAQLSGKL